MKIRCTNILVLCRARHRTCKHQVVSDLAGLTTSTNSTSNPRRFVCLLFDFMIEQLGRIMGKTLWALSPADASNEEHDIETCINIATAVIANGTDVVDLL